MGGCGRPLQNNKSEQANKAPAASENNNSLIFNNFNAVLENSNDFYSVDTKGKVYLKDFLINEQIYGTTLKINHFTIIDIDSDKIPEIILELSDPGDYPVCYEVLHYMNSEVYGYNIVYRGLQNLKEDGTFIYSSGASDNGCGKLNFASNEYKTIPLGDSKLNEGKKDVTWYEFSKDNIKAVLS